MLFLPLLKQIGAHSLTVCFAKCGDVVPNGEKHKCCLSMLLSMLSVAKFFELSSQDYSNKAGVLHVLLLFGVVILAKRCKGCLEDVVGCVVLLFVNVCCPMW